jgi:hypothetical protein
MAKWIVGLERQNDFVHGCLDRERNLQQPLSCEELMDRIIFRDSHLLPHLGHGIKQFEEIRLPIAITKASFRPYYRERK